MGVEQNSNQNRAEEYQRGREQIKGEANSKMRELAANMFKAPLNEKLAKKPSDAEKIAMVIAAAQRQAFGSPEKKGSTAEKPKTKLDQLKQKNLELKAAVDKLGLPRGYKFDGKFIRDPGGEAIAVFSAQEGQFKFQRSEYSHSLHLSAEDLVSAIRESVKNNKKIESQGSSNENISNLERMINELKMAISKFGLPNGYTFNSKEGLIFDQKGSAVAGYNPVRRLFICDAFENGNATIEFKSAGEMLIHLNKGAAEQAEFEAVNKVVDRFVMRPIREIVKGLGLKPFAERRLLKLIRRDLMSRNRDIREDCKVLNDRQASLKARAESLNRIDAKVANFGKSFEGFNPQKSPLNSREELGSILEEAILNKLY